MTIFGDLERAAAAAFPYRWYILAALVLGGAALIWIGARLGWGRVIARHARLTAVVVFAMALIGGPITYLLASPLFIRTELNEVMAAPPSGARLSSGPLIGADELHFGSGQVSIVEIEPGRHQVWFEGIAVQNGPDLFVYLSPEAADYSPDALELGKLRATNGTFTYDVPAGTDLSRYRSVVIWCRPFAVLFAVAPLTPG